MQCYPAGFLQGFQRLDRGVDLHPVAGCRAESTRDLFPLIVVDEQDAITAWAAGVWITRPIGVDKNMFYIVGHGRSAVI